MKEQELLSLMDSLDRGTNTFGALSPEVRARLFAVADQPSQQSWEAAHTCMINDRQFITLWQALIRFTDYRVMSKPADGDWPLLPTREQILTALAEGTKPVLPRES